MSSFYVGYLPKAPREIAQFVRRAVAVLLAIAMIAGVALVVTQHRFDRSNFEFTQVRSFHGTIEARPYPSLLVLRPGIVDAEQQISRFLLVGLGKHGAEVSGLDGAPVELKGKLIYRAEQTMIEVMPGTIRHEGVAAPIAKADTTGTLVTIRGEIVDSKCHTGVMNPGSGKVHRDCAVRCLSGGVPPVLVEDDAPNRLFLLTDANADRLPTGRFLDRVAEPVEVTGYIATGGDRLELQVQKISRLK
jgi:hypothetical protein